MKSNKKITDWIKDQYENIKICKCINCGTIDVFADAPICYQCKKENNK